MHKYTIIDAHAHIFPEKIEEKAVKSIGNFYDLKMHNVGSSGMLLKSGAKIGVSKYLVCSTATRPEQVDAINGFIKQECDKHKEFIGFATLHPDYEDMDRAFDEIEKDGFKGIKLHPDFQHFSIDDEKAFEIYKRAEGRFVILFHTGDKRYEYSNPRRLARVTEKFPNLRCIAAHFGGYSEWEEAYNVYESKNIFMDTSSSLHSLDVKTAIKFIEKFGDDHFFFGTDFPMWTHDTELERLRNLGLDDSSFEKILSNNFINAVLNYNSN